MAESADRNERCIQHLPTAGVVNEVKSPAAGAPLDILVDGFARVIDRCRTQGANVAGLGGTRDGIDFRTKGSGDLNSDMTDASTSRPAQAPFDRLEPVHGRPVPPRR